MATVGILLCTTTNSDKQDVAVAEADSAIGLCL